MAGASGDVLCVACDVLDRHHEVERRGHGTWGRLVSTVSASGGTSRFVSWARATPLSCENLPSTVASHSEGPLASLPAGSPES